ncbi:MAG: hypothetical protein L0154_16835 [Chloroflexi bacterium]|nr:hypothetical protein [Chloroflexota bacterium]
MKTENYEYVLANDVLLDDGELPANLLANYPTAEIERVSNRAQPTEWLIIFMMWLACMTVLIGGAFSCSLLVDL